MSSKRLALCTWHNAEYTWYIAGYTPMYTNNLSLPYSKEMICKLKVQRINRSLATHTLCPVQQMLPEP